MRNVDPPREIRPLVPTCNLGQLPRLHGERGPPGEVGPITFLRLKCAWGPATYGGFIGSSPLRLEHLRHEVPYGTAAITCSRDACPSHSALVHSSQIGLATAGLRGGGGQRYPDWISRLHSQDDKSRCGVKAKKGYGIDNERLFSVVGAPWLKYVIPRQGVAGGELARWRCCWETKGGDAG